MNFLTSPAIRRVGAPSILLGLLAACSPDRGASTELPALEGVASLPSPADSGSTTPHLAVTADGRPVLSWAQRGADSTVTLRLSIWNGSAWDSTRTVAADRPFFANWADFPSVTALGNGDLAAHWLEREGGGKYAYGIRVVRSADGGATWSTPVTPHTDGLAAEHGFVSLWAEGADQLGLVWLDGRKSAMPDSAREMTIRSAVITPTGTMERERLVDARSCDCCQTGTAATAGGRVLVYRDRTSEEIRDIAIVRQSDSGWTAPQKVHEDGWHYPGCPVNGPQADARGDTVVVAWYTAAQDTARVFVARSVDAGATFGAPVRVDAGDPVGRVDVVLDPAGRAVVTWLEQRSPEVAEVLIRRVDLTAGTRSAERMIASTSGARQSGFPRMVRAGDDLFVAWTTVQPKPQVHVGRIALNR